MPDTSDKTSMSAYDPYSMRLIFGLIGVGSMIALIVYNRLVSTADAVLITASWYLITADGLLESTAIILITLIFCMMMIFAFAEKKSASSIR